MSTVVVLKERFVLKHKETGLFAVRYPEVGASGYHEDVDEADRKARTIAAAVLNFHNNYGGLENFLCERGVSYYSEEIFKGLYLEWELLSPVFVVYKRNGEVFGVKKWEDSF